MGKKAILFIGLPGAGKTTIVEERYSSDYIVVSADVIKEKHPDYNPENTVPLHEWSVAEAEIEMNLLSDMGEDICMDSGGVNNSYSLRIIGMLKSKGYHITLVYVDTPLDVCLERNRERLRKVPESAILEKSKKICSCLEKQMAECDDFIHIQYDKNKKHCPI